MVKWTNNPNSNRASIGFLCCTVTDPTTISTTNSVANDTIISISEPAYFSVGTTPRLIQFVLMNRHVEFQF